jgi:hypothetical protein
VIRDLLLKGFEIGFGGMDKLMLALIVAEGEIGDARGHLGPCVNADRVWCETEEPRWPERLLLIEGAGAVEDGAIMKTRNCEI